jgi:hypothetical protein
MELDRRLYSALLGDLHSDALSTKTLGPASFFSRNEPGRLSGSHAISSRVYGNVALYQPPLESRLVLFTRNVPDGTSAMVTIDIDSETIVDPSRCDCHRAGAPDSSCPVASIRKRKKRKYLNAIAEEI